MGLRCLCFWLIQNAGMGDFRGRSFLLAHQLFHNGEPEDHPLETPRKKICRNRVVIAGSLTAIDREAACLST